MSEELSVPSSKNPVPWRVWPGWLIVVLVIGALVVAAAAAPGTMLLFVCMMGGPLLAIFATAVWLIWGLRANKRTGIALVAGYLVLGIIAAVAADPSMQAGIYMYGIPVVPGILATGLLLGGSRISVGIVSMAIGWAAFACLRIDGLDAGIRPDFALRWSERSEDQYVQQLQAVPTSNVAEQLLSTNERQSQETGDVAPLSSDWPGFRGPHRDGHVANSRVSVNWDRQPPRELWRRPIGVGWSSFAVAGPLLFTQEQRGEDEVVACLDAETGGDVWQYNADARFWEVVGGAGPRATPTYEHDHVYAMTSHGKLVCIHALTGELVWEKAAAEETGVTAPTWGFSASPLVVDDQVIVFVGSPSPPSPDAQAAGSIHSYDKQTGQRRWTSGGGKHTYSSPHLLEIDGVRQIIMTSDVGMQSFSLSGELLWENAWPTPGYRVTQPAQMGASIFYGTNNNMGMRRLDVAIADGKWTATEAWTSKRMKPYFNDYVVHKRHIYGFDNSILVCMDAATGERMWKGGRYGAGQLILLADQDVLLVVTESKGDIVLVSATPDSHQELSKQKLLTGKTWNHPVLVDGRLYVRNGEEAACFEMTADEAR